MSTVITGTSDTLAKTLELGVRTALKARVVSRLREAANEVVEDVAKELLSDFKGVVSSKYDIQEGQLQITLVINHKEVT